MIIYTTKSGKDNAHFNNVFFGSTEEFDLSDGTPLPHKFEIDSQYVEVENARLDHYYIRDASKGTWL